MNYRTIGLTAALLTAASPSAFAATTFKAAVEGNKIVVYSTTDKDIACYTMVTFSFQSGDKRVQRRFVCNMFAREGKDQVYCERSEPEYIDLQIEGPVTFNC